MVKFIIKAAMIIFYLIFQVGAVKVISNFPEVNLYANEKYYESITNYFSGTDLEIQVNEINSSVEFSFECSTKSSIQLSEFIEFPSYKPSSQYRLIAIENTYDYTILALNNDTVILVTLSKINLSLNVTFNQTLKGKYPDASIRSGILTQSNIIILIENIETIQNYSFTRNDILYAGYEESSLKLSSNFWDLRYKENVLISTTDSNYVAFVAQNDGNEMGGIYVLSFSEPEYPILVQVIDKFEYVPINVCNYSFPKINDLLIQNNFLLVLTSDNLIIVFKLFNDIFVEQSYTNFTEFGQVKNLAHFKNFYNYIPVSASNYAVVYNVDLLSKLTFSSSRIQGAKVTYAQELAGFLFFSTTTNNDDAFFEIVSFSYNSTQNVTLINMGDYVEDLNPSGSWILASTPFDYSLIRQDHDGIRLFKLLLPSYLFIVSSQKSVQLNITASDKYNSISNIMTITISSDLGNIYPTFRYFNPKILQISYPVYFLKLSQSIEFSIYEICSGWNLTYSINNSIDDESYEITVEYHKDFQYWTQVMLNSDIIDAGFYGGTLYLMDSQGNVYKDQTKMNISSNALAMQGLSSFNSDIVVIYSDYILCYDSQFDIFTVVNLISLCEIFKVTDYSIICASDNTVQILNCYQLIVEIFFDSLDGPIKDIAYCENSMHIGNFVYILMDSKVYIYELLEYAPIFMGSKYVEADKIFCYLEHVALLTPTSIEIYTIKLEYQLYDISLYSNFTSYIIDQNILILQSQESIYLYNIQSTALSSLVSTYNIGPCSIKSSNSGFILTNCTTHLNIFNSSCPPLCEKISKLNFVLLNIDNTTQGTHILTVPINVSNGTESQVFNISFDLITYDSALFFDNSNIENNYTYSYDMEISETLKYYINGYNLDAVLLINNEAQNNSEVQPVNLVNRLTLNYDLTFDGTVNSYAVVPDTNAMILIINGAIVINNETVRNENYTYDLNFINGSCLFVEYVARTEELGLFVCYGIRNSTTTGNYYDGSVYEFTQAQPFLIFFTLDIEGNFLMDLQIFYISFRPRLIKVVSGSQSEFLIICISSKSYIFQDFFNDDIIVYKCKWALGALNDNIVEIKQEFFINFFTLKLETFAVMSIDGIFNIFYENKKAYNIYLYAADASFGIRVLKIANDNVEIVQEIQHVGNPPISLTVCSVNVFVVTLKTSLIIYNLDSKFKLNYYVTYPESSVNKYIALNSVSSCSSYYNPTYFSFYLQEKANTSKYILRIISLTSDLNSSVHKDISISGFNNNLNRPTSLFKNQNTITFFTQYFTTYEEHTLNDFTLEFNSMNKSQYEQMIKNNMDKEKFNFTIKVFKDNNMSRISQCFNLTRTGYSSGGVTSKEVDYIYLIVGCTAGVFLILVIISFCVYRRIMKRKKVKPEASEARFKLQILSKRISSTYFMNSKY